MPESVLEPRRSCSTVRACPVAVQGGQSRQQLQHRSEARATGTVLKDSNRLVEWDRLSVSGGKTVGERRVPPKERPTPQLDPVPPIRSALVLFRWIGRLEPGQAHVLEMDSIRLDS
jgi:hypothetical protein